jgi:uncharacterized protein YdhG (YjbR/CyaY superfamily)
MNAASKINDVDTYIEGFPGETRKLLEQLRTTIKRAAPDAKEVISYQMPAYKLQGMLVYFAAYAKHIGFYPASSGIAAFKKELSVYKGAKGSVQFPLDEPLPLELVAEIVAFKVKENVKKAEMKASTRK